MRLDWQVPGLAVAVVKEESVVFTEGFGFRDVGRRLPVTDQTVFQIGSTTKGFTATVAALLVDDEALDLDEPIVQRVPEFRLFDPYETAQMTLRDLLCHRSGLPPHHDMVWLMRRMERDELFRNIHTLEAGYPFRSDLNYSNLGYALAGTVLERLVGMSWECLVRERILEPLGMDRTGFGAPGGGTPAEVALAYRVVDGEPVHVPFSGTVAFENSALIGPAGSMHSTISDLSSWLRLQLGRGIFQGRRLVSEASLAEVHAPQMAIRNPGYRMLTQADPYGLGWTLSHYRGHRVVAHGGNIEGFSAMVSFLPELDLGVAVLSNTLDFLGHVISRNVYDRFLASDQRDCSTELKALFGQYKELMEAARMPPVPEQDAPSALPYSAYEGIYDNPVFGPVSVMVSDGSLKLVFHSGLGSDLHHIRQGEFKGTTRELYLPSFEVAFPERGNGRVTKLILTLQPGTRGLGFQRVGESDVPSP
jgi:CubicO group peptidase (beta-lactamase class C family)